MLAHSLQVDAKYLPSELKTTRLRIHQKLKYWLSFVTPTKRERVASSRFKVHNPPLGQGLNGVVYRATDKKTGQDVAIKFANVKNKKQEEVKEQIISLATEAKFQAMVKDKNILAPLFLFANTTSACVVMPFAKCDSRKLAEDHDLTVPVIAFILKNTLRAIDKLHQSGIVHHDIKAANVMVMTSGEIKLADFGLASYARDGKNAPRDKNGDCTFIGTTGYVNPTSQSKGYTKKDDIVALGSMAIQLAIGGSLVISADTSSLDGDNLWLLNELILSSSRRELNNRKKAFPLVCQFVENCHVYKHSAKWLLKDPLLSESLFSPESLRKWLTTL